MQKKLCLIYENILSVSSAVAYEPNRYRRVHLNTVSLNYASPKALVGASLKGYSLHCIIFRTATEEACGRLEFDYDFRYVFKNGQNTKNAKIKDRYIPKNDRGQLTYL